MEEFLKTYLCLCRDRGMEPQESVVAHLQESRGVQGFKLNLNGLSLSVESCCVLGQALQCDKTFTEVSLNDCMLSEEGARVLLNGLFNNTTVKVLELKGNNLRVKGADVLGKLLTCNKTLCRLVLEWNSLGMWDEAFSLFCRGLASNRVLTHLDLRNNQINHHGAAELALALKCNNNMQVLDLRWNNIGLLGGRSLLEALQKNMSLVQLEMAGNNIPSDLLRGLERARCHNSDKQSLLSENRRRVQILTKEIYATKAEGGHQLLGLMETIDRQREEMGRSSRSTSIQIGQLKEALNERKCTFKSLTAKLHMTEAALALSEEKNHKVEELLAQLQMETEKQREQQIREGKREQEENVFREGKLLREIQHLTEINIQLRSKVKAMEHKCKCQQQQIFGLKQESVNNSAELKLRLAQAEERLESEKQRFKQVLENTDILHRKKVEQVHQHLEESKKTLQEQIFKLEAQKTQLEEEVSKAKAASVMERVRTEEELGRVRAKVILEEQAHISSLEDKLHSVLTSQQELQLLSCQQRRNISELRFKINQLSTESDGLRSKIKELEQELACKDQERLAAVSQVKAALKDQIGHLHAERTANEALQQKINDLEREIKVLSSNHRKVLLDKESEVTSVLEKLRLKEKEIQRMREDESHRASHLQSAILTYFPGSSLEQYRSPKK